MRKLILMTSAAIIVPLSGFAENITCTATPNCADLGYTSTTSCDNGVKCPWGEAWYCPPSPPEVCEIGSILYSDMTCYKEAQAGKTPIGVVVYVDGTGAGQAMALKSIGSYTWGPTSTNIPGLTNYESKETASTDYVSCENSKIIMAQGDSSTYPAVWAAHEYSTEGTEAGDWCLPAAGIFTSYYNYNNRTAINSGFDRANGIKFESGSSSTRAWSSSEYDSYSAWFSFFGSSYGLLTSIGYYKTSSYEVRPVFEFTQKFNGMCKGMFLYSCEGEGYLGGIGENCGGRYKECSCAEGYEWFASKCTPHCEVIGNILYSDKTCSKELDTGKTPIGIIVYLDGDGGGQALALNSLDTKYAWGGALASGLTNLSSSEAVATDFASCENSEIIMAAGNSSTYPAVWAAHEYSTEGTSAGDWCLPAAGIFTSYYKNQAAINAGFNRANGTPFTSSTDAWASSQYNGFDAWYTYFGSGNSIGLLSFTKRGSREVRPVIEF